MSKHQEYMGSMYDYSRSAEDFWMEIVFSGEDEGNNTLWESSLYYGDPQHSAPKPYCH